jgi:hypothetical protein
MAKRAKMERGAELMFVPGELVQEYLDQGWKVIDEEVIGAEVKQNPEGIQPATVVKPRAGRKSKSAGE